MQESARHSFSKVENRNALTFPVLIWERFTSDVSMAAASSRAVIPFRSSISSRLMRLGIRQTFAKITHQLVLGAPIHSEL